MEGCVMAKVSVVALDAVSIDNSAAFGKQIETRAIFNREKDPIHLHSHRVKCGEVLRIAGATDCLIYVWSASGHWQQAPV
jgi:predicted secreted acid phosphatase